MANLWHTITRNGAALMHIALPCRCALCGHLSPNIVCDRCDQAHWRAPRVRCRCCALPLTAAAADFPQSSAMQLQRRLGSICGHCIAKPPAFDTTFALADYAAPLDTLALALKFNARLAIANYFAQRLASFMRQMFNTFALPDFLIPVPLSKRRLIARGYNQAWEIARPLARMLNIPAYASLLTRLIDTPPQARLDARARQSNMRRAFAISPKAALTLTFKHGEANANAKAKAKRLSEYHVAVVDDVMTSGATLEAIAHTLKRAGAARVTNLVALRTPKGE